MMRRYLPLAIAVVAVTGITSAAWWAAVRNTFQHCWYSLDHEATLNKFRQLKLGMTLEEVDTVLGFQGEPGMGTEDVILWHWRRNGECVELNIGQEDGKVKGGDYISANGKQYWLLPEE